MAGIFQRGGKLLRDGSRLRGCCCEPWVVFTGCRTAYVLDEPQGLDIPESQCWPVGFTSWNAAKIGGNVGIFGFCRQAEFAASGHLWRGFFPAGTSAETMDEYPFGGYSVYSLSVLGVYDSPAMARAVCETYADALADAILCGSCAGCAGRSAAVQTFTFSAYGNGSHEFVFSNPSPCADRLATVEFSNCRNVYLSSFVCPDIEAPPPPEYWGAVSPDCDMEAQWEMSGTLVAAVPPQSACMVRIFKQAYPETQSTVTVTLGGFSVPACPTGDPLAAVPRNAEEFKAATLSRRLEGEL